MAQLGFPKVAKSSADSARLRFGKDRSHKGERGKDIRRPRTKETGPSSKKRDVVVEKNWVLGGLFLIWKRRFCCTLFTGCLFLCGGQFVVCRVWVLFVFSNLRTSNFLHFPPALTTWWLSEPRARTTLFEEERGILGRGIKTSSE